MLTLSILYKRRPIRDGRQILEKNKRRGLAFSKKLRDSAHWGPESVEAEFALEAFILEGQTHNEICSAAQICIPLGISPIFGAIMGHLKGLEAIICIFLHSAYPNLLEK